MRSVAALLLLCLAGASALVATPGLRSQQVTASRAAAPVTMTNEVVRVEIELEQGEPCALRSLTPHRRAVPCTLGRADGVGTGGCRAGKRRASGGRGDV